MRPETTSSAHFLTLVHRALTVEDNRVKITSLDDITAVRGVYFPAVVPGRLCMIINEEVEEQLRVPDMGIKAEVFSTLKLGR